jgi:hypothetical protein
MWEWAGKADRRGREERDGPAERVRDAGPRRVQPGLFVLGDNKALAHHARATCPGHKHSRVLSERFSSASSRAQRYSTSAGKLSFGRSVFLQDEEAGSIWVPKEHQHFWDTSMNK